MDMDGLSPICAGLGAKDDEDPNRIGYTKGEHCLDNLKDLLRFLRRDDPQTRDVFKQVCKWNIVAEHLIPIIENFQDDRNLILNAVKVLVFLTMPIDPTSTDTLQQLEYLWNIKSSITSSDVVAVIVSFLESPLDNLEKDAFTEDDWKLVQLVLTLFRNILAVKEIPLQKRSGELVTQFISLRDQFLELLFHENVMDIVLVITQYIGGSCRYLRQDNLLLLEIFHHVFTDQEPELIVKSNRKQSKEDCDPQASVDSLKSFIEVEQQSRRLSRSSVGCHSRFSGTFARLTMDGSKAVFNGKPTSASCHKQLKSHKSCRGRVKRIPWDHQRLPSRKTKILELLHGFMNHFLSSGYNVLMQSICEDIEKEHHAIQKDDVVVFFQVAEFVTSFQYFKFLKSKSNVKGDAVDSSDENVDNTFFSGEICGPISVTMQESMFQLVISKMRDAFEGLKETNGYNFLSAAGSLLKYMILMLDLVLESLPEDSKEPQTARILLYKLFYDQTDQGMTHFLLNLIKVFDGHKQPKSDLANLVQIIYKVVKLMENLQARGTLRVSRKARKIRKKKLFDGKESDKQSDGHLPPNQDGDGVETSRGIVSGTTQLQEKESPIKANLLEDEINAPAAAEEHTAFVEGKFYGSPAAEDNQESNHVNDDVWCDAGDLSGDEQLNETDEVDFRFSTLVSALASNNLIQKLCSLLKFYKTNSLCTNHYIISLLKRITEDLGLHPMLYQLSLMTTFYDILGEQKACPSKEYANIVEFLTNLVRKMLKRMKNQPLLFVEILFWKSRKECHYINAEYMLHDLKHLKKETNSWGDTTENENVGLSPSKVWTRRNIADALGEDEADVVITHDLGYLKNSEEIDVVEAQMLSCGDMKNEEKVNYSEQLKEDASKTTKRKRRLVLDGELEAKLKDLYEKFKNDRHCSRLIAENLDPDSAFSPAQITNKLKQLGLKVGPKKCIRSGGDSSENPNQLDGVLSEENVATDRMVDMEGCQFGRPQKTRKRVHALSKDQEDRIRALYEQFKEHERCSYMISNEMVADGKFTPSQISRKLKQLGLSVPRKNESKAQKPAKDYGITTNKGYVSDDETLFSLINRKRDKEEQFTKELPEDIGKERHSNDGSDDEILSSVIKKTQRLHNKPKKFASKVVLDDDFTHGNGKGVSSMDLENQSSQSECLQNNVVSPNNSHLDISPEREVISDAGIDEHSGGLSMQQMDDELADSGDEVTPSVFRGSSIPRRRLRMVIDAEDSE